MINEIKDKKIKDFEESVKTFKNDENYEFKNLLLERYFFFKAVQEINEGFLVDFTNELRTFFDEQTLFYWEEKGYFNYDNSRLYVNLAKEDLYYLDLVIKEHTKDKEFISNFKKLETNLSVLYIGA